MQTNSYNETIVMAASCDKHLTGFLLTAVADDPDGWNRAVVQHIGHADPRFTCSCQVPAQWVVRQVRNDA